MGIWDLGRERQGLDHWRLGGEEVSGKEAVSGLRGGAREVGSGWSLEGTRSGVGHGEGVEAGEQEVFAGREVENQESGVPGTR